MLTKDENTPDEPLRPVGPKIRPRLPSQVQAGDENIEAMHNRLMGQTPNQIHDSVMAAETPHVHPIAQAAYTAIARYGHEVGDLPMHELIDSAYRVRPRGGGVRSADELAVKLCGLLSLGESVDTTVGGELLDQLTAFVP